MCVLPDEQKAGPLIRSLAARRRRAPCTLRIVLFLECERALSDLPEPVVVDCAGSSALVAHGLVHHSGMHQGTNRPLHISAVGAQAQPHGLCKRQPGREPEWEHDVLEVRALDVELDSVCVCVCVFVFVCTVCV